MLEKEESWFEDVREDRYELIYQQEVCLNMLERRIQREKKIILHGQEYRQNYDYLDKLYDNALNEDVLSFIKKYPNLDTKKLAIRIRRESEYMHLSYLDEYDREIKAATEEIKRIKQLIAEEEAKCVAETSHS